MNKSDEERAQAYLEEGKTAEDVLYWAKDAECRGFTETAERDRRVARIMKGKPTVLRTLLVGAVLGAALYAGVAFLFS